MSLAKTIAQTPVKKGEVVLFYLAQAGFCLKTAKGTLAGIDLYLSDCCERMFQFKRLIPAMIRPEDLSLDILSATHAHADHLDPDALCVFVKNSQTFFIGAKDCRESYEQAGIHESRFATLRPGDVRQVGDIQFRAIYADHGELAPDAVGLLMTIDGFTIYHTGDTALQTEKILSSLGNVKINAMIAPINGAFGNLNAKETCQLASAVKPDILIGAHFGMFEAHGGNPAEFLAEAKQLPPEIQSRIMKNGEKIVLSSKK